MDTTSQTIKQRIKMPKWIGDRVLAVIGAGVITLAAIDTRQAMASLGFTAEALWQIAPFFIFAVVFAAYAKASRADQLIARAFSGHAGAAVLTASLAGALSPLCSCGVIPLIAAMLSAGVPLAPVLAFCIASPIMDPEMFILTAAGISPGFAVAKTIAALSMGLLSGFAVYGLQRLGYLHRPLKAAAGCGCGRPEFDPQKPIDLSWRFWHEKRRRAEFAGQIRESGFFLGKWMALAFFIESLMVAYLPAEAVGNLVGVNNAMAIPVAAIIGIPAYMNGYAAIPLVSGLMELGMTPGAALAFMTAGAVSSIPAAMAVFALVRRPVFLTYLGLGLFGALATGTVYHFFINTL